MASRILTSTTKSGLRLAPSSYPALRRPIAQSATLRHKESHSQNPDINEQLEKHKRDSLARQAKGSATWKPELASDSEEAIHSEKQSPSHLKGEAAIKDLQERTKHAAKEYTPDQ